MRLLAYGMVPARRKDFLTRLRIPFLRLD